MGDLQSSLRLRGVRRWWPKWIYRSDHVENAARILNSGVLLSRARAEHQGCIAKDSGSQRHIAEMTQRQRDYVRLYFRPRTPTQFANEGIRPSRMVRYGAHMPVPVYFLFSVRLLAERGVTFTRGRLTSLAEVGRTAAFLRSIKFADVYHDSGVGSRREILNARNAEVLVANELPLDYLRLVVCRSEAELETLLSLLDGSTRASWIGKIVVDEGPWRLFNRRATYVKDVRLESESSRFAFYGDREKQWRGPFDLHIEWTAREWRAVYADDDFVATADPLEISLPMIRNDYVVRVTLNGDLCYLGSFYQTSGLDLPF